MADTAGTQDTTRESAGESPHETNETHQAQEEAQRAKESFDRRFGYMEDEHAKYGDPYEVLGLDPNADTGTVKETYHKLAFMYHPDTGGETKDPEAFKGVQYAYDALNKNRDVYDEYKRTKPPEPAYTWEDYQEEKRQETESRRKREAEEYPNYAQQAADSYARRQQERRQWEETAKIRKDAPYFTFNYARRKSPDFYRNIRPEGITGVDAGEATFDQEWEQMNQDLRNLVKDMVFSMPQYNYGQTEEEMLAALQDKSREEEIAAKIRDGNKLVEQILSGEVLISSVLMQDPNGMASFIENSEAVKGFLRKLPDGLRDRILMGDIETFSMDRLQLIFNTTAYLINNLNQVKLYMDSTDDPPNENDSYKKQMAYIVRMLRRNQNVGPAQNMSFAEFMKGWRLGNNMAEGISIH